MKKPLAIKYIKYLDTLRNVGIVNMWKATPYIRYAFRASEANAIKILSAWMEVCTEGWYRMSYEDRAEMFITKFHK